MGEDSMVALPDVTMMAVADIRPYWRNPRRIPDEAVAAVAESIQRYGYQQPIVVDPDGVIIVGHTRHAALKKLGVEKVPVYVAHLSEEKAKEYRLVDNRTGEMSGWDHGALVSELREWEASLLETFFPDVDLEVDAINAAVSDVTADDVDRAAEQVVKVKDPGKVLTTEVVCPACFHTFTVRTDSLPGLSRVDLEALGGGDGAG